MNATNNPTPNPAPTKENGETLTLVHFGDLHVWHLGWDFDPSFKRLLGLGNLVLRRGRRFPFSLAQSVIERLGTEDAGYMLFTGDITTTALKREFNTAQALLRPLAERWERRFIAIPGNHDRYTARAVSACLFENHFLTCPPAFPFAMDLDDRWTLVAFDCCVARRVSSRGHVPPAMLAALDETLAEQRRRGRRLAVTGHYPLIYPTDFKPGWEHVLPERHDVLAMLEAHGAELYLHGHVHRRWRIRSRGVTHLNCGSAGMNGLTPDKRPGYLRLRLGAGGLEEVEACRLGHAPLTARLPEPDDWVVEPLSERVQH